MADKEASVRANLNASGFLGGLRTMGAGTRKFAAEAKHSIKEGFSEGLREARRSLGETGREIKHLGGMALTLGGAFSLEEGVRSAIEMQEKLSDIANQISINTGRQTKWEEVQKDFGSAALATNQRTEDLADAWRDIFEDTGNVEYATNALRSIGTVSTATGRPVKQLGEIAGALSDKFKINSKELPDSLAALIDLSNRGGAKFEELANVINTTGASALAAGLSGEDGFRKMLAMANIGGDALKNMGKGVKTLSTLLDSMVDPNVGKQIKQFFNVNVKDAAGNAYDATKTLEEIFKKTHGKREELAKVFKGEQLKLVTALGANFTEAYANATGSAAEKTKVAAAAFEESLRKAEKTNYKFSDAQRDAAERAKEPAARFKAALEKLQQAFLKPQMTQAIDKLAEKLPKLADAVVKAMGFALDHPGKALAIGVAAKTVPAIAGGVIAGVGGAIAKKILGRGAAAAAGGALAGGEVAAGGAVVAGGGTAALGGAAGLGLLGKAGLLVGGSTAATVGVGALAGGSLIAAADQFRRLKNESGQEGIWESLTTALSKSFGLTKGGPTTREEYDEIYPQMAKGVEEATEKVEKHGAVSEDASVALKKVSTEANKVAASFQAIARGLDEGGAPAATPTSPARGPVRLPTPGAGSAPVPFNR